MESHARSLAWTTSLHLGLETAVHVLQARLLRGHGFGLFGDVMIPAMTSAVLKKGGHCDAAVDPIVMLTKFDKQLRMHVSDSSLLA